MITTAEFELILAAALIVLLLAVAYGMRLATKGRAHFDRVDRQDGSRLLGKGAMEFAHWVLEPVARLLVSARITPNQVSWTSLSLGFLAGAALAFGHFGFGALLAMISGLLDSVDGMVARISGVASDAGEVLDSVVDRYVEFFFLLGLVIYYRGSVLLQVVALLALLGSFMVAYSTAKAEALKVAQPKGSAMRRPERALYLTVGAALSAISIPLLEAHRESVTPIGYPMIAALLLVAVVANLSAIERFWCIAKAARLRRKIPAEDYTQAAEKAVVQENSCSHNPVGTTVMKRKSRPPLIVSLRRSQVASLTATIVDFGSLIFLVEVVGIWYVTATAVAAFLGALVNFALGRHWTFEATEQAVHGQMLRYAVIALLSLILNSGGVYLLTDRFGIYYMLSKAITAFSVGILFNFPLHRYFVFGRQKYA